MSSTIAIPTDFAAGHLMLDTDIRQYRTAEQQISALLGDRTSYSPAWTGAISNPAIGNGNISGFYQQIGKLTFFTITVGMGSTTTFGSGAWFFSLPATGNASSGQIGHAALLDSGVEWRAPVSAIYGGAATKAQLVIDHDGGTSVTPVIPWTFKTGDVIFISGMYWAA